MAAVVKSLLRKFIKSEVLEAANSQEKLCEIEITKTDNHVPYSKIDVGLQTENALKNVTSISQKELLDFKMECKAFLVGALTGILKKSPITYSLVRNMACLDPRLMATDKQKCHNMFKRLMKLLIAANRVNGSYADQLIEQYDSFLDSVPNIGTDVFLNFAPYHQSLDHFFANYVPNQYRELFGVFKLLLILSHGQASVERGFSVNKEIECENLKAESLVAQRIICDYVRIAGGVLKVPMTNQLLVSAASARQRYTSFLESQREKNKLDTEKRKRKDLLDDISDIKKRKKQIDTDVEHLNKTTETLLEKAEQTGQLKFLCEGNANRRRMKEKKVLAADLQKQIDEKVDSLKTNC